ncbi:hypothetical protein JNUCC1_00740 [Lentibacillus sp. JNUCC-1]|uniref:hypothetical protein n=1 Tax=Lentibacillus sp. JNUCC-1 TaxID=2654513 RepID=UPI00132A29FB|nr:hypothetical protein [Lentibacillus sp. JNUCC-1]MUV36936.1 hypothetical protein [Lentibacillus sp. JNUCC-1]
MGKKYNPDWAEAKKRCKLNLADIQMAKELGMKPKSLIKNIPGPKEKWKAPVKYWVRDLYEEKFGKVIENPESKHKSRSKPKQPEFDIQDEDLPF